MPEIRPPPNATPFVLLPEDVARLCLRDALARLSSLQRQVILLHLRDRLSVSEIAARLGVAPAAAGASLAFATSQLRVQLSERPQDSQSLEWLDRCGALLRDAAPSEPTPLAQALPTAQASAAPPPHSNSAKSLDAPAQALPQAAAGDASIQCAAASDPPSATPAPRRRAPVTLGLWPRLPAALGLLVLGAALMLGWQAWEASRPVLVPVRVGPQRMPPPTAPEAPLTAPDFMLVLLRQQSPGLLEDLEFNLWLSEQESLQLADAKPAVEPQATPDPAALRQILAPFEKLLAGVPPVLRLRLELHAHAWLALSQDEQTRLRAALAAWDDLPPQEKLALRERFEAWEQFDAPSRQRAQAARQRAEQMPGDVRAGWRARFDALSPEQRQRYRFDPDTRAAMDLAGQLFPFVPAEEHAATLALLRALAPEQVEALRRELRRLPPNRRDAFRVRLLELDAAGRAALLDGSG